MVHLIAAALADLLDEDYYRWNYGLPNMGRLCRTGEDEVIITPGWAEGDWVTFRVWDVQWGAHPLREPSVGERWEER